MRFTVEDDEHDLIEFECADTIASRWVCGEILAGRTYPYLPFVSGVQTIFDVGANCGATTVYLAHRYPDAEIHAFEPGSEPRAILERNTAEYRNVQVQAIGLHSTDQVVPLYKGDGDTGFGSVFRGATNLDESEPVQLRAGGAWAAERGIDRIDVLKVDVEGCEIDVIRSLVGLLPTVKVLYVEYDSRRARRDLDRMLANTHDLYIGKLFLDQGECIYLRRDVADSAAAGAYLRRQFALGLKDQLPS